MPKLITLCVATLALLAFDIAAAQAHDSHRRGHRDGHYRWHGRPKVVYYRPAPVVYHSYARPVYYLPPTPPPAVVYRQSGFGFWLY